MSTPTPIKLSRPCIGASVLRVLLVLPVLLTALVLPTAAAPLRMATEAYVTSATSALDESLSSRLSLASLAATNYADTAANAALSAANDYTDSAADKLSAVLGTATNDLWAANAAQDTELNTLSEWYAGLNGRLGTAEVTIEHIYNTDLPELREAINGIDVMSGIAATNTVFSNAVLSVGLGVDTNTVAAINALVEAGDELPIGGAATVGGLLLALAAAVAALKRTKADAAALRYAFAATIQPTAGTAAPTGTLTDRAEIKVVCTEATGQTDANAKLTLTLPPAVPGYVRDFLVKIDRTTSGCYSVDFVPYGNESVRYETEDGSMPEVPDGKVTWLSFTENESGGVFTVRAMPLVAVTGGV